MSTGGRYVPPHLRNRPPPSSSSTPDARGSSSSSSSGPRRGGPSSSASSGSHYTPHSGSSYNASHPNGASSSGSRGRPGPSGSGSGSAGGGRRGSPSLYVFGDSFVGPFKLLADDCAKTQTFKGSSAKGLNNPNSIKQVSNELVPLLNSLLAPPPYAYLPPTGRYALLIFGNVDLQINYLWQLQHKPIGPATWARKGDAGDEATTATSEQPEGAETVSSSADILATATENAGKGPALGPDLFVDTVLKAYTSWLEREVVNGPIGRRAAAVSANATDKRLAPTRVLVAGALPPLVEDGTLPRIPEKYVERLEEDHTRAHRALERGEARDRERGSRTPWSRSTNGTSTPLSELERGLAAVSLGVTTGGRNTGTNGTSTPAPTGTPAGETKTPVVELLKHKPALCTKPVRVSMTERFNTGLKAFCALHPSVLSFVDISDAMRAIDAAEPPVASIVTVDGEVERATWACPVDPSNIHPLWEPTLPLWLKALGALGVPTDSFAISADAEETFRNYEADKRRRTEEGDARLKLRDE